MRAVMKLIDRAALRDTPILLVGESGTGKELLARALHKKSPRAAGPFLAVNCSAIPERSSRASYSATDGVRSPMPVTTSGACFNRRKGARSSSTKSATWLRPAGKAPPCPAGKGSASARSACPGADRCADRHSDPSRSDVPGRGRMLSEDLLYRVNVIRFECRRCRRPEDLGPCPAPSGKYGEQVGSRDCRVSHDVMAVFRRHTWPGNVREIENVIERALVLGTGRRITLDDLPETLRAVRHTWADPGVGAGRVEREHIVRTLRAVEGNRAAAARVLGLNRKTLYRKLTSIASAQGSATGEAAERVRVTAQSNAKGAEPRGQRAPSPTIRPRGPRETSGSG